MNKKLYLLTIPGGLAATYGLAVYSWLNDWSLWPLGIAALTFNIALLFIFILTYHMWKAIYTGTDGDVHPWAAVLYNFIPLFNLYWLFQSIWGWAKRYNAFIAGKEGHKEVPANLYLAYVILWFLSPIPYVGLVTVPIAIALVYVIVSTSTQAITALKVSKRA